MTLSPQHLMFIDFEASGLGPDSWPVEVGLAWIIGGAVQTWSSLIRPEPGWDQNAWSFQAVRIHGIQRAELDTAPGAAEVADELLDRIEGKHIISDSGHDRFWADQLLETVDLLPPPFVNIGTVIAAACDDDPVLIKRIDTHLLTTPRPHRAGPDAARLAEATMLAMKLSALK